MRPLGRFEFKKGDTIPQWVERTNVPCTATFGCDVLVFSEEDGVHVLPIGDGDCVLRFRNAVGPLLIIGAPTHIRSATDHHPYSVWQSDTPREDV